MRRLTGKQPSQVAAAIIIILFLSRPISFFVINPRRNDVPRLGLVSLEEVDRSAVSDYGITAIVHNIISVYTFSLIHIYISIYSYLFKVVLGQPVGSSPPSN